MKNTCIKLALATCMALTSWAAMAAADQDHGHEPKFGGVVVETKAGDFEIVAKADALQIYIRET